MKKELSIGQKRVLKVMRNNVRIVIERNNDKMTPKYYFENGLNKLRRSKILDLMDEGLIKPIHNGFEITELGKTIEL